MREVEKKHKEDGVRITDADDAALIALTLTSLASILQDLSNEASKFGLKISVPKTKWMKIGIPIEGDVLKLETQTVEEVKEFKYLGSIVDKENNTERDLDERLKKANQAFKQLWRGLWKRRDIRLKTKMRVYRALIEPIALYGAEAWTLTIKAKEKLDRFDRECMRVILGIKWYERVSDEEMRNRIKLEQLSERAVNRLIRWAGHVWRMDENNLVRKVEKWTPIGRRKQGPQKPRWKDKAVGEARLRGVRGRDHHEIEEQAKDRIFWRNLTRPKGRETDHSESV